MRKSVIALSAAAVFGAASIASAADVTGTIKSVDISAKKVTLENGETFKLESSVNTAQLKTGEKITLTYTGTGSNMVASAVQLKSGNQIARAPTQWFEVSQVKQMPVVNDKGDKIGSVENVVDKKGTNHGSVIIQTGQYLGIGGKALVVPFKNLVVRANKLVVTGLSKNQLASMPDWKNGETAYQIVPDSQKAELFTAS